MEVITMSEFLQKLWEKQLPRKDEKPSVAKNCQTSSTLDIALMFDTTGSMYSFLEEVRRELSRLALEIHDSVPNARVGVIAYGDYCDAYVTKVLDLTDNFTAVKDFVRSVEGTGGGDFPEAVEEALYRANQLNWRIGSNRAAVLVGDAPPHGVEDSKHHYDYKAEANALGQKGVRIYATECGTNESTERVFRWLAAQTNGTYLKLENIRDLVDLLIGICMKEVGLLDAYMEKLAAGSLLTGSKAKIFKQLTGSSDAS
jgi:Mg-chelatase subunit ChlD